MSKKTSLLFVLVLGLTLVFSFGSLADEGDYAISTVTFQNVLDINVTGGPTLTVTQDNDTDGNAALSSLYNSNTPVAFTPNLTVELVAITDYQVGASFYASGGTETADGLLEVVTDGGAGTTHDLLHYDHSSDFNAQDDWADSKPASADVKNVTGTFSGGNNMSAPPGESQNYQLNLDLSKLSGNYSNSDTLDLQVAFWAFEGTSI